MNYEEKYNVPTEIILAAEQVRRWAEQNGHKEWMIAGCYSKPQAPVEPLTDEQIKDLMAKHDYCVTESATIGFARGIESALLAATPPASKADTGEWRQDLIDAAKAIGRAQGMEDGLEKAADLCNELGANWIGESNIASGYLADCIRDLKSATPSAIKAEPTGEQL